MNLEHPTFTEANAQRIGGHTYLQTLNLSNTPIDDSGITHLQILRELKTINLYNTKVTNKTLEYLKKLTQLRKVITWGYRYQLFNKKIH